MRPAPPSLPFSSSTPLAEISPSTRTACKAGYTKCNNGQCALTCSTAAAKRSLASRSKFICPLTREACLASRGTIKVDAVFSLKNVECLDVKSNLFSCEYHYCSILRRSIRSLASLPHLAACLASSSSSYPFRPVSSRNKREKLTQTCVLLPLSCRRRLPDPLSWPPSRQRLHPASSRRRRLVLPGRVQGRLVRTRVCTQPQADGLRPVWRGVRASAVCEDVEGASSERGKDRQGDEPHARRTKLAARRRSWSINLRVVRKLAVCTFIPSPFPYT